MAKIPLFGTAYLYVCPVMSNVHNHNGCSCPIDIVTYVGVCIQLSLSPTGTSCVHICKSYTILLYCMYRCHVCTYIRMYMCTHVYACACKGEVVSAKVLPRLPHYGQRACTRAQGTHCSHLVCMYRAYVLQC